MFFFLIVVLAAIIFEYSNGFHDAANAIATVVSTKVLTPRQAIAMAAFFNLTGALFGGAVAATVGKGLVDNQVVTMSTILCAVLAAFIWNMLTWWFGLPSSSSHALIGGLCGAALATAKGDWSVIKWNSGLWPKVVVPMITSPIAGFILGGLVMFLLFVILHKLTPHFIHQFFGKAQILSAAWMALTAPTTRKKPWASSRSRCLPERRLADSIIFRHGSSFCTHQRSSFRCG
jgi:PiT family inorganic phosphate transporter